jgi:Zn-dependent M28 family amino/carboxypeptidase
MKGPIVAAVSMALGYGLGAAAQREFDGARAMAYAQAQVDFGPRVPNTEGHRAAGDWILEQLRARTDSVEVQAFAHITVDGDTLHLRNFIGRIRPEVAERIVYMAHWDTRPRSDQSRIGEVQHQPVPGANDGASGVALLLGVADALAQRPSEFGVDLVFVDGEDYGSFGVGRDVLLGSKHYAAGLDESSMPLFAVVWDMVGDADLRILQEGHSVRRAPEVVERVWGKARELGYGETFSSRVRSGITDDHLPLLDAGVRAIDVIDLDYPYWHTPDDTMDKISQESLQIVGDVAVALLR